MRGWIRNQPVVRKLSIAGAGFVAVIGLLLATGYFAMNILSTVRAYVGGEGLWSKAEKSAVIELVKYARSEDERDYERYRESLRVPLADKRARLELEKPSSDLAVADQAFIEGRNHPDDVHGMSLLFKRFRKVSYIDRAIAQWAKADSLIEELDGYATELHAKIASRQTTDDDRRRLMEKIDSVGGRLTEAEDAFSFTLGEAARWLLNLLVLVMSLVTVSGLTFGLYVAFVVSNGIVSGVANLRSGTDRVGAGDFEARIPVDTTDELGDLAVAFNRMTDRLVQSIEERKNAETQLASHAKELEVANRTLREHEKIKSEFFSNVSHELRTPLSLILAPLESLLENSYGKIPEWARPALETMHNNGVRLLQMVQGLLDFQKLEANKIEAQRESLDVAMLTRAIVADFEGMMKARGIRGHVEVVPDAPLHVAMDRYMFERILFNLLSNAVKFTREGGDVFVRLTPSEDGIVLSVRDTGIGIAPEDQARLFKRFHQVEGASTRRFEGVGLGLALVKEFAALLSGTVSLESEPGKGSTFTVACQAEPRAASASLPVGASSTTHRQAVEYRGFTGRRADADADADALAEMEPVDGKILIVEDNQELGRYIQECLAKTCETRVVHDGNEALAVVREWMPTLVLSDVMMPGRDGLSLCRELKADPKTRTIPFVLLTALTYREALLKGWEAGADDYLFKPFHPAELVTRMRALLVGQIRLTTQTHARQHAEQALLATTRQLADAQRIAHVGSWEWDIASNKITWSDELFRMFGLDPAEFVTTYEAYLSYVHPDDREVARSTIARAMANKESSFGFEHRVTRKGGEIAWVQSHGRMYVDAAGNPTRMSGTAHEITERKQMETGRVRLIEAQAARHAAEEARERSALLSAASALLGMSLEYKQTLPMVARILVPRVADWCAVTLSPAVVADGEATGGFVPDEEPRGSELRARWDAEPAAQQSVADVLRTGATRVYSETSEDSFDAASDHADDKKLLKRLGMRSVLIVPIVAREQVLGTLSVGTARGGRRYRRADLELCEELGRRLGLAIENARLFESEQAARLSADRANRAKDDFLATVSHELRTPMNAMLGWTHMLRTGVLNEEKRARALETIERNARNQAQLIEDLLDVSRIINGKLHLTLEPVELVEVVEQAIDALRPAGLAKSVRLYASLDSGVGPVIGDSARLQQVIWNLLNNAIKFTPSGGRIDVTLERANTRARLLVRDTGQGISSEFLPHVFERFSQEDGTTTRAHGGLGIGLAIARQIIDAHGGTIDVESGGDDRGSTFIVELDLAPSARDVAPATREDGPVKPTFSAPPELRHLKVLVVDDEADARDLLSELLQKCGAEVRLASSAASALDCIVRERPDVLISDIGMPGEDGYDLIRKVRALGPGSGGDIPAAALTAYAGAEDRQKVAEAGYMMHMAKPVEPSEFVAVVANLTRFASAEQRAAQACRT